MTRGRVTASGHGGPSEQELALRDRLGEGGDILERSPFHRGRLDRAGLADHGLKHFDDLVRLPPMVLDDLDHTISAVLESLNSDHLRHRRRYWPLQWIRSGHVPLAYSADDLEQLGDLGRDLFEATGIDSSDVVANLLPSTLSRDFWQTTLGAQAAGLSTYACGPDNKVDDVDVLAPTVLVGEARELVRILDASNVKDPPYLERVHTLIVTGPTPLPRQWSMLVDAMGGDEHAVLRAWAPDGALAMWGQCRGGVGMHTAPDFEIVEIVDPLTGLSTPPGVAGHIVWTGTGWFASALVRLNTFTPAIIDDTACPSCGRVSPRVRPLDTAPGFPAVLDANETIDAWVAELQRIDGRDELALWIALTDPLASLQVLADIDARIGPARVSVVDRADVERRVENANGERFGDRRAAQFDLAGQLV